MTTVADLSYKLYTDAALTTLFSGLHQLTHQSDLSDNPQDFQLWFGSTIAGRQLQESTGPGTNNITLTPIETLPAWAASTVYALGDTREPTVDNALRYEVTVAGTSAASEPTWPTTGIGSTVVDGTVTWALVAATHEPAEIKLAATAGGLPGATGGAALSLGTTLTSGVANAVEVNIRYTNAVTDVSSNIGKPELSININSVVETG